MRRPCATSIVLCKRASPTFRSSVLTPITLDADLDRFVNAIDELTELRFWFQFLIAPSFALFDALDNYQNESSIDEFLRVLFLSLSCAEVMRFIACVVYIFRCRYLNKAASYHSIAWSILKFDVFEFAIVAALSCTSYILWAGFLSSSTLQMLFYLELFMLPIWYFKSFLRIRSFVFDALFEAAVLWAKFKIAAPFGKHAKCVEPDADASARLLPSHTNSLTPRQTVVSPQHLSLSHSLAPLSLRSSSSSALSVQHPPAASATRTTADTPIAEASPETPLSPDGVFDAGGRWLFGDRFKMVSRPELYAVLPSDVIVNEPFEVLGEGKFGLVLKAKYVNGDAVIKLSKSQESLPIKEECRAHWKLTKVTTCVADLKGFVAQAHDGRTSLRAFPVPSPHFARAFGCTRAAFNVLQV